MLSLFSYHLYVGSKDYSTSNSSATPSVSSSNQKQPSVLPVSASSVTIDSKRHSTGSVITQPSAPFASKSSSYEMHDNPFNAPSPPAVTSALPSHRASMPITSSSTTLSQPSSSAPSSSQSNPFIANPFGVSSYNTNNNTISNDVTTTTVSNTTNPFGNTTGSNGTYTSLPTTTSSASTSHLSVSSTDSKRLSVKALYDHEAEEEDELNFKAGDTVEVVEKLEGGWWRGSCRGKVGLFPCNYVQNP